MGTPARWLHRDYEVLIYWSCSCRSYILCFHVVFNPRRHLKRAKKQVVTYGQSGTCGGLNLSLAQFVSLLELLQRLTIASSACKSVPYLLPTVLTNTIFLENISLVLCSLNNAIFVLFPLRRVSFAFPDLSNHTSSWILTSNGIQKLRLPSVGFIFQSMLSSQRQLKTMLITAN